MTIQKLNEQSYMLRKALTYLVLTLIVLQSAVAMGDAHQLHQSGAEHLAFDETHQHENGNTAENLYDHDTDSESSTSDNMDCHHCCHCHGHFCFAVLISTDQVLVAKNTSPVPDYSEGLFPDTYETFLRPPKA